MHVHISHTHKKNDLKTFQVQYMYGILHTCTCTYTTHVVVYFIFNFTFSVSSLCQRQCEVASDNVLIWDKDCSEDLDFVVSASNLRASVFGIPMNSKFTIKCESVSQCRHVITLALVSSYMWDYII